MNDYNQGRDANNSREDFALNVSDSLSFGRKMMKQKRQEGDFDTSFKSWVENSKYKIEAPALAKDNSNSQRGRSSFDKMRGGTIYDGS